MKYLVMWALLSVGIWAASKLFSVVFIYAVDHPTQAPYMGAAIIMAAAGLLTWFVKEAPDGE